MNTCGTRDIAAASRGRGEDRSGTGAWCRACFTFAVGASLLCSGCVTEETCGARRVQSMRGLPSYTPLPETHPLGHDRTPSPVEEVSRARRRAMIEGTAQMRPGAVTGGPRPELRFGPVKPETWRPKLTLRPPRGKPRLPPLASRALLRPR